MENRIAKIISVIFHPLLMPTYAYLLLLNVNAWFALVIPPQARWLILGMAFVATFCIPLLITFFLYRRKMIRSFEMVTREERALPYLMTALSFYFGYYLLNRLDISPVYPYFMIGATFLIVMTLAINFFWKISSHMVGVGAVTGLILGISWVMALNLALPLALMFLVSGMVGYARLRLNAHRPAQIYAGYMMGLLVMGGLFLALDL